MAAERGATACDKLVLVIEDAVVGRKAACSTIRCSVCAVRARPCRGQFQHSAVVDTPPSLRVANDSVRTSSLGRMLFNFPDQLRYLLPVPVAPCSVEKIQVMSGFVGIFVLFFH